MWPTEHPPRWRALADSGPAPVGPAMATWKAVIARLASLVRSAGIVYLTVQVAVWHSFYAADPWRLAGPAVATGWAVAVLVYLRRCGPGPLLACLDSAVYLALAVSAQGCVPPAIRGHVFSWLVISILGQLMLLAWCAPAALCVPLALASPLAYWTGVERLPGGDEPVAATAILLLAFASAHIYGRRALYRNAAAADAALDQADRDASEQYAVLSRNLERREHERLLHDTILNTLTALARADDVTQIVSRCRQDVTMIEGALTEPGDRDAGPSDLAGAVRAVADEMRARGLTVHVEMAGDGPHVPPPVATAIAGAVREALSNVAAHAGTGEAWVEVGLNGREVTVRDRGAGFDPAAVDPARLGLRRSITERVADCGGRVSIWSAPRRGTVVRLSWEGLPW